MSSYTMSYYCCQSESGTMFSSAKFKAIDYVYEASARHRLMMHLLVLPVPYQLSSPTYPHSCSLQEVTYRQPWRRGNGFPTWSLNVTGSVLDYLKATQHPLAPLERFGVTVEQLRGECVDVVPSSNPASQVCVRQEEALWLMEGSGDRIGPCDEFFSKYAAECYRLSHEDLFLPEEVLFANHWGQFMQHLPPSLTLLSRLKTLYVTDPLLSPTGAPVNDDIIFRHCSKFEITFNGVTESSEVNRYTIEKVQKETILNEESLMLPAEIETRILPRQDGNFSFTKLCDALEITAEPIDNQISLRDILRVASPEISQYEILPRPACDLNNHQMSVEPISIGPRKLCAEMEIVTPLTPPHRSILPMLSLSSNELSVEPLSPIYGHRIMSDEERDSMEQVLWMTEKHPDWISRFLLAEPHELKTTVQAQPLSGTLGLFGLHCEKFVRPRQGQINSIMTAGITESTKFVSGEFYELPERMFNEGASTVKMDAAKIEEFSPLSIVQIDDLLRDSSEDPATPRLRNDGQTRMPPVVSQTKMPAVAVPAQVERGRPLKVIILEDTFGLGNAVPGSASAELISRKTDQAVPKYTPLVHSNNNVATTSELQTQADVEVSKQSSVTPIMEDSHSQSSVSTQSEDSGCVGEKPKIKPVTVWQTGKGQSITPLEDLDPLLSFMMLRSQQKTPVHVVPQQNVNSISETKTDRQHTEPAVVGLNVNARSLSSVTDKRSSSTPETNPQKTHTNTSKALHIHPTESQCQAYRELQGIALPCLSRVSALGLSGVSQSGLNALTTDYTRFLLKQQEKELSNGQGQEALYNEVALLHILVTVKELLFKCDLNSAADYLVMAKDMMKTVGQLAKKFRILQYVSEKTDEPNPKILELQDQVKINWTQNAKILVVASVDSDHIRTVLARAISQVSGSSVAAVVPGQGSRKVDSRTVTESLCSSGCLVLCSQHMGPDFPWSSFSVVCEYDGVGHSPVTAACRERGISHITFPTEIPPIGIGTCPSYLDGIPFVLVVTDGLLRHTALLQALESTYNVTLLERPNSPAFQLLGGTHHCDVITVDESTAVLIQEVDELVMEHASESFVLRLMALSLQYTYCWVILCWPQGQSLSSGVYNNIVLIYSAFVLIGLKSEDLDVKVLLACKEVDIAHWIYQIAYHTLLHSEVDASHWLDRDWLSVLPTQEETCLLFFPCVNPLVAQLMLKRAQSLQWLLGASSSELQDLLPEVPHKVIKLFTDTTALYTIFGSHADVGLATSGSPPPPRGLHGDDPASYPSPDPASDTINKHPQHCPFSISISANTNDNDGYFKENHQEQSGGFLTDIRASSCSPSPFQELQQDPWETKKRLTGQFGGSAEWMRESSCFEEATSLRDTHNLGIRNPFCRGSSVQNLSQLQRSPYSYVSELQTHSGSVQSPTGQRWNDCFISRRYGEQHSVYSPSPNFGTSFRIAPERKRRAGDRPGENVLTVSPEQKRGKLSYERVPGRSDGQTRLRFF